MVVFVFITTPVQLWHHHPPVDGLHDSEATIHSATKAVHSHCDVCEHKYTAYFHEAADWQLLTPSYFVRLSATPFLVFPHTFLRQDANKGPPAHI
jgi:hypothetical protein